MSAPPITGAGLARTLPLGDALPAEIARMREIAAAAADTLLLAEGPSQPDGPLLDLCAEAVGDLIAAASAYREYCSLLGTGGPLNRARGATLMAEHHRATLRAKDLMRRAKKIRALTPAGIYAKALVVRASRTGAAGMAMSLAEDMVSCAALRQTLWPHDAAARP